MSTTLQVKPWDLSHVLELVNSLSAPDLQREQSQSDPDFVSKYHDSEPKKLNSYEKNIEEIDYTSPVQGLGNLSRVFQYLGTPSASPAASLAVQTPHPHEAEHYTFGTKDDYASDGATYFKAVRSHAESVQLNEDDIAEDLVTDTFSDGSAVPDTPALTKTQRKRQNRRARREKEAALATERAAKKAPVSVSESEADLTSKKGPARKASSHVVPGTPSAKQATRKWNTSTKVTASAAGDSLLDAASIAVQRVSAARQAVLDGTPSKPVVSKIQAVHSTRSRSPTSTPKQNGRVPAHDALQSRSAQSLQWPHHGSGATRFFPSTVQPLSYSAAKPTPIQQYQTPPQNTVPRKPPNVIEPMIVRSGEDRHWALLMKLIGDFYEDRKHLISPMNLTTHNNDPKGIHIFVDASNIFIGFNEQLKRSRGIPPWVQVPAVDLSFDALGLLMERRRPVAKRVLVGSMPNLPAFDKAKAVGYECSILEKVYKARELTERQIYFRELDRADYRKRAKAPPANTVATAIGGSGSGSGSETNVPQYAPPRMIEQGVDEILHLKILESVVDADAPGTIVLATGDAAQAEYSEGFMAMAERALKKGWTVELVSWSKNISAMYTRKPWREAWGERFKIVTLDDYAEELLDM